jgi:hypothetical protein
MKRLAIFLFLPLACTAQGVRLAQYDVFLKKQRIELDPVTLLSTSSAKLTVTFSSVAPALFVQLRGAGWGATTIDEGDGFVFHFTDDSAVVKSTGLQTFEPGIPQSTYKHQYQITEEGVQALARNEVTSLRKYSFKESSDVRIPKELGAKLQKSAALFLVELRKRFSFAVAFTMCGLMRCRKDQQCWRCRQILASPL